jgi:hypothetical protein
MKDFKRHRFPARRDLLQFVKDNLDEEIYEKLAENTKAWVDELGMIYHILTGDGLGCTVGMHKLPLGDPNLQELGENGYLYQGDQTRLRGLFLKEELGLAHYNLGNRSTVCVNPEFSDIPPETFLPENVEQQGEVVKNQKRPILKFPVTHNGTQINIYAKGAIMNPSLFYGYAKPGYRLTNLAGISKVTSKQEIETTIALTELGVNVPKVIAEYDAISEEFAFFEEIKGDQPNEWFETHRDTIIEQDASMLAALCLLGIRKWGFHSFDDKVFDGTDLYLIDVEECGNLYGNANFRRMVINPRDTSELRKFRRHQRSIFTNQMKDALYEYRETLTQTREDQTRFISSFHKRLGWKEPTEKTIDNLTNFSDDYLTKDRYESLMSDTD